MPIQVGFQQMMTTSAEHRQGLRHLDDLTLDLVIEEHVHNVVRPSRITVQKEAYLAVFAQVSESCPHEFRGIFQVRHDSL